MDRYDGLKIGDILSEIELQKFNKYIYNNSLKAVGTGNLSQDGSAEYKIEDIPKINNSNFFNIPMGSLFGEDIVSTQKVPEIVTKFDEGLPLEYSITDFQNGGYWRVNRDGLGALQAESELGVSSDPTSSAFLSSLQRLRYQAGQESFLFFTCAFKDLDTGFATGDFEAFVGMTDTQNGYLFGFKNGELTVRILYDGEITDIPVALFNGDDLSNINWSDLNIFVIYWGYLGIAPTRIYVYDKLTQKYLKIHQQEYLQQRTSIGTPNIPIAAFVQNNGNDVPFSILNGSIEAGSLGAVLRSSDPSSRNFNYEREIVNGLAATSETLFAFQNNLQIEMYDYIDSADTPTFGLFDNTIDSQLLKVKAITDANKPIVIDLYIVPISDVLTGTFNYVNKGSSVLQVSEDATVSLLNATKLDTFLVSQGSPLTEEVINGVFLLFPGFTAVFQYSTTSVNYDFVCSINYADRF